MGKLRLGQKDWLGVRPRTTEGAHQPLLLAGVRPSKKPPKLQFNLGNCVPLAKWVTERTQLLLSSASGRGNSRKTPRVSSAPDGSPSAPYPHPSSPPHPMTVPWGGCPGPAQLWETPKSSLCPSCQPPSVTWHPPSLTSPSQPCWSHSMSCDLISPQERQSCPSVRALLTQSCLWEAFFCRSSKDQNLSAQD